MSDAKEMSMKFGKEINELMKKTLNESGLDVGTTLSGMAGALLGSYLICQSTIQKTHDHQLAKQMKKDAIKMIKKHG